MKKQAEQKATNLKAEASSRALVSCEFTSHKHFFLCRAKSYERQVKPSLLSLHVEVLCRVMTESRRSSAMLTAPLIDGRSPERRFQSGCLSHWNRQVLHSAVRSKAQHNILYYIPEPCARQRTHHFSILRATTPSGNGCRPSFLVSLRTTHAVRETCAPRIEADDLSNISRVLGNRSYVVTYVVAAREALR